MQQLAVLLSLVLLSIIIYDVKSTTSLPPQFILDIGKAPINRWEGAVTSVLKIHPFEYSFGPVFEAHNETFAPADFKVSIKLAVSFVTCIQAPMFKPSNGLFFIKSDFISSRTFICLAAQSTSCWPTSARVWSVL